MLTKTSHGKLSYHISVLLPFGTKGNTKFFEPIFEDLTREVRIRVNLYVHDMFQRGQIPEKNL